MACASSVSTQAGDSCARNAAARSGVSGGTPPSQGLQRRAARSLTRSRSSCAALQTRVAARHVLLDDLLEFLGDLLALERDGLRAVLVHRCHRTLAGAWQADAEVGVLALAGTVDDAAHYGDRHVLDAGKLAPPLRHARADVRLDPLCELLEIAAGGAAAARAGDHQRLEGAQSHGLQDLLRHEHLLRAVAPRLGCERCANGVADAF